MAQGSFRLPKLKVPQKGSTRVPFRFLRGSFESKGSISLIGSKDSQFHAFGPKDHII